MIIATFSSNENKTYTQSMHQHDKGQTLILTGIELPEKFVAHFSNDSDGGLAYPVHGKEYQVRIPDAYFRTGKYIYCWIYVEDSATEYTVVIPVIRRPGRIDVHDDDSGNPKGFQGFVVDGEEGLVPVFNGIPEESPIEPDLETGEEEATRMTGFKMEDGETLAIV